MLFLVDCSAGGGRRAGHGEGHRSRDEGAALGVHRLDPHLVLAARQADEDDRVAPAVVRPLPGQIVERDVQVPDPGRDVAGGRPADGNDAKVLQAVRNEDDALGERSGKRRLHGEAGRGFVLDVDDGALRESAGRPAGRSPRLRPAS